MDLRNFVAAVYERTIHAPRLLIEQQVQSTNLCGDVIKLISAMAIEPSDRVFEEEILISLYPLPVDRIMIMDVLLCFNSFTQEWCARRRYPDFLTLFWKNWYCNRYFCYVDRRGCNCGAPLTRNRIMEASLQRTSMN